MISHKQKCIFIHIPKTAGTSINTFFHPGIKFHFAKPDYDRLFGWCPKRKIHMQHATSKQLLETELISEEQWSEYFKFTFVRNPWDRAYSDYKWIQEFSGISGSFENYIDKKKEFDTILNDMSQNNFLGDHILPQTDFFDFEGIYAMDFIGRFENFNRDIKIILESLSVLEPFNIYKNKSNRDKNYSNFYTGTRKSLIEKKYEKDIKLLGYQFEDNRTGINFLKKYL